MVYKENISKVNNTLVLSVINSRHACFHVTNFERSFLPQND